MGRADVRHPVVTRAVALPPLVLGVVTLLFLVLSVFGANPLWPRTPLNPAEAVATGDEAEFIRLIQGGADPNARVVVRAGLRESVDVPMTPLEAAVDTQSAVALQTVFKYGGLVNGDTARGVMCIAYRKSPDLLPILKAHGAPEVDPATCPEGQDDRIKLLRSLH